MANLPELAAASSAISLEQRKIEAIADHIADGKTPGQIAAKMYPHDAERRKIWRNKIRRMMYEDPRMAIAVGQRAKGELIAGLGPTTRAVVNRASRGRIDAAKLVYETTGFHNPKVKHEHSGEIKVKLEMPRPDFNHEVPDADVVEE